MTTVQAVALCVVALAGGAVVLVPDPLRQVFVLGVFGLSLTFLFFAFQAPDVALSQTAVGAVALPLMILLALAKVRGGEE